MTHEYIWHTVHDSKVRPEHAARDGKVFSWASPPEGGHPGEDYNCRCWAENIEDQKSTAQATGLQQELTPINESGKKWTTFDFAFHFAFGNGRGVTLSEIGYLSDVISVSEQKIYKKLENQVADKMKAIKSGPLTYRTDNWYNFTDAHWVLGKGTVQTITAGHVNKDGNILTLDAEVTYSYSDEITDPFSIREAIRGHHRIKDLPNAWWGGAELFATDLFLGRAYPVTGRWKTRMTGSISID